MVCSSKFTEFGGYTGSSLKEARNAVEVTCFLYAFYIEIWNTVERIDISISLSFP